MREQLVSKRPEELRRSREFWRKRAEETQRSQKKKRKRGSSSEGCQASDPTSRSILRKISSRR